MDAQTKIYDWYKEAFPHDEWAISNLNRGINFQDVYECLEVGYDIYSLLGAGDSLVRERVFDALATIMECSYDYIYYQWRDYGKKPLDGRMFFDLKGIKFTR